MWMSKQWGFLGLLLVALAAGAGCGGGKSKPVKVEGTLTLDGKPLPGAAISFVPAAMEGRPATGRSEVDGGFRLTTFATDDGALPGEYKVIVTVSEGVTQHPGGNPMDLSDKDKMAFFMKMSPQHRAKEESKKSKSSVPEVYTDVARTPLKQIVPAEGKVNLELRSTAR
jgi:hypothetical protein